jgi:hypothetical protein
MHQLLLMVFRSEDGKKGYLLLSGIMNLIVILVFCHPSMLRVCVIFSVDLSLDCSMWYVVVSRVLRPSCVLVGRTHCLSVALLLLAVVVYPSLSDVVYGCLSYFTRALSDDVYGCLLCHELCQSFFYG